MTARRPRRSRSRIRVLLEPIPEYALEQLVARGELAMLQRAHAKYYLGLAQTAAAH